MDDFQRKKLEGSLGREPDASSVLYERLRTLDMKQEECLEYQKQLKEKEEIQEELLTRIQDLQEQLESQSTDSRELIVPESKELLVRLVFYNPLLLFIL